MAKLANGHAGDLASTTLLATDKPVLIAPAMNVRMWTHAATQRNLATLKQDGITIVGPNDGEMACGEFGPGRMAEPVEIVSAIEAQFAPLLRPLAGRKVLITAGPTREPIDPVRFISNHSSGKQGYAIAAAAVALGAETVIVSGPVNLPIPPGAQMMPVETAQDMLKTCEGELPAISPSCRRGRLGESTEVKSSEEKLRSAGTKVAENPTSWKSIANKTKRPPRCGSPPRPRMSSPTLGKSCSAKAAT
jgi:phosphopantothenoylcysteine decarboxylase/phosphopantothenate--cysteine ligase